MTPADLPNLGSFGPFVLIQITVSVVILATAIGAWIRGGRQAKTGKNGDDPMRELRVALAQLHTIADLLGKMITDNDRTVAEFRERHNRELELLDDLKDLLSGIKDRLIFRER